MRRRIIESLTYPRILMIAQLDPGDCPLNRYFDAGHQRCRECEQGRECRWLSHNDEFSVLAEQPMERLFEAFSFSIDYVDAQVARQQHNFRRCVCDSCAWLRDARHLAREFKGHTATVPGA
ncbi:MAG: hypothetical protein BMS9Abin32_246 [Gammaproteobacteria bacterium]|nr:MAG: hypothetical protein BMS9Abin32_246 [Gammaproteobacteria bacterium]